MCGSENFFATFTLSWKILMSFRCEGNFECDWSFFVLWIFPSNIHKDDLEVYEVGRFFISFIFSSSKNKVEEFLIGFLLCWIGSLISYLNDLKMCCNLQVWVEAFNGSCSVEIMGFLCN